MSSGTIMVAEALEATYYEEYERVQDAFTERKSQGWKGKKKALINGTPEKIKKCLYLGGFECLSHPGEVIK